MEKVSRQLKIAGLEFGKTERGQIQTLEVSQCISLKAYYIYLGIETLEVSQTVRLATPLLQI